MVKDGVYLSYVKDGTIYPVVLTEEQHNALQMLANAIASPLPVALNHPQGKATNIMEDLRKGKLQ